ncbi:MAG: ammonium transporter, partial [Acidithiobacillus sp.]|nr:ammonium transporter [Acidithiobacillus sp.]
MLATGVTPPGGNVFFLLMGAILVFAMHAGFAFLELGTVRRRSQVNALVKILSDFGISTIVYFFIGYHIAYGISFFGNVQTLTAGDHGFEMVRFFFLLTFAAAVPAIISGGIAERARFYPQLLATAFLVGLVYPFYEGIVWDNNYGIQAWFTQTFGAPFHDFAGSVVVHAMGGWMALMAVWLLGPRRGRYGKDGTVHAMPPSNIPFLALGSWILIIGWFGFNVMSAQQLAQVQGLVALNSLMALVGGMLAALAVGKGDPGFVHNGALAGLVAICAGSDVVQPIGALAIGAIAGIIFVYLFTFVQ